MIQVLERSSGTPLNEILQIDNLRSNIFPLTISHGKPHISRVPSLFIHDTTKSPGMFAEALTLVTYKDFII